MKTAKKTREMAIVIISPVLFWAIARIRRQNMIEKAIIISRKTMHFGKHRTSIRYTNEMRTDSI
jgi:hypothetical protein